MLLAVIIGIVTGTTARGLHPSPRGIELLGQLQAIGLPIFGLNPYSLLCIQSPEPGQFARRSAWRAHD